MARTARTWPRRRIRTTTMGLVLLPLKFPSQHPVLTTYGPCCSRHPSRRLKRRVMALTASSAPVFGKGVFKRSSLSDTFQSKDSKTPKSPVKRQVLSRLLSRPGSKRRRSGKMQSVVSRYRGLDKRYTRAATTKQTLFLQGPMIRTPANSPMWYPNAGPGLPMKQSWRATPSLAATTFASEGQKSPSTKMRSIVVLGKASSRTKEHRKEEEDV